MLSDIAPYYQETELTSGRTQQRCTWKSSLVGRDVLQGQCSLSTVYSSTSYAVYVSLQYGGLMGPAGGRLWFSSSAWGCD